MSEGAANSGDLLARLKTGDGKALAELFSRERERLGRVVRFRLDPRLARRVDADDVLQEVYLSAAQRIGSFQGDSAPSFFIWLRLIARQTMIDIHRRHLGAQLRDACREVPNLGPSYSQATSACLAVQLAASRTSPSQAAIRDEISHQIERAIETMDPIDREILALRHFEELTNSEVAEELGIQQKAASIRYVRALTRLRQILVQLPDFASGDRGAPGP